MATKSAVTKQTSTRFRTFLGWPGQTNPRQQRELLQNDAALVAFALNASRGTPAHNRLASLYRDLWKLQGETAGPWPVHRIKAINHRLTRYVFHPMVGASGGGRFGLIARSDSGFLPAPENQIAATEADAALSLVRLHAMDDLRKVCLCETCRKRWLAASHSNYRFCSKECRERFFQSQPDYHKRKARNQQKYRDNLKLKQLAEDAARMRAERRK